MGRAGNSSDRGRAGGAHPTIPAQSHRKRLGRRLYLSSTAALRIGHQGEPCSISRCESTCSSSPRSASSFWPWCCCLEPAALPCRCRPFGCAALFVCGIWMIARMYQSGAKLGIMSPLLAAVIPLGVIAIGILLYNESVSPLRVGLLVGACAMIGAAAAVP